jgi:DNA repair protein RadC
MRALFPQGSAAKSPLAADSGQSPFTQPKSRKVSAKERGQISSDLLSLDVQDVPDYLLVAMLLLDVAKSDPVKLAQRYLAETDHNLARILGGERLIEMGLGDEARARLAAAGELARRAALRSAMSVRGAPVLDASDAVQWLRLRAEGPRERLVALYLNNRSNVMMMRTLTEGSHRYTVVDPLQILRPAIEITASSVILAHQHPSGDSTPSPQDLEVTRRVISAATVLGIHILDHLVIVPDAYVSIRESTSINFNVPHGSSWTA